MKPLLLICLLAIATPAMAQFVINPFEHPREHRSYGEGDWRHGHTWRWHEPRRHHHYEPRRWREDEE